MSHTGASTTILQIYIVVFISYFLKGAYYAAQVGINLRARDAASRDLLLALLSALEQIKNELGPNDAIHIESASSAYVENFAIKVFVNADNEDRSGHATRCCYFIIVRLIPYQKLIQIYSEKVLGCGQLS